MLVKQSLIEIFDRNTGRKKYSFELVNSVVIESSRNEFTDTCTVILPNRLRRKNNQIKFEINIGDRIVINLGYKPDLIKEFDGFVASVDPDSPMTLKCEDQMFLLKRKSLDSFVLRDTTLSELIDKVYTSLLTPEEKELYGITGEVNLVDAPIGTFKVDKNQTPVDVFDALRKNFKVYVYFQEGTLYAHILLSEQNPKVVLFDSQKNVPQGTENVNFQTDTDGNIVAYGISENKDGTKVEVYAYYKNNLPDNEVLLTETRPNGTLNTLKVPNRTKDQMSQLIKQWLPNLYYTGAVGDISTFGSPSIKHGDIAELKNRKFPDRDGRYKITYVSKEFSVANGYKQTVNLGLKVN